MNDYEKYNQLLDTLNKYADHVTKTEFEKENGSIAETWTTKIQPDHNKILELDNELRALAERQRKVSDEIYTLRGSLSRKILDLFGYKARNTFDYYYREPNLFTFIFKAMSDNYETDYSKLMRDKIRQAKEFVAKAGPTKFNVSKEFIKLFLAKNGINYDPLNELVKNEQQTNQE